MLASLADLFLQAVLPIVFACHLICVNIAAVGPLACVWLEWRASDGPCAADALGQWLAHLCWKLLIVGMLLGLVAGLILWWGGDRHYFAALAKIPRDRLYWGGGELLFYFACMVPYAFAWRYFRRWRWTGRLLAVAAATNLMYHFPPLFAIVANLAASADAITAAIDKQAFKRLLVDHHVVSRVLHHLLAGVAVVGAVLMLRAGAIADKSKDVERHAVDARLLVRQGAILALAATLLQLPAGIWMLLRFPAEQRDQLMGGQWLVTGLFIGSLIAAMVLMHHLAAVAMGDTERRNTWLASALLFLVILLMTATLDRVTHRSPRPTRLASDELGQTVSSTADPATGRRWSIVMSGARVAGAGSEARAPMPSR